MHTHPPPPPVKCFWQEFIEVGGQVFDKIQAVIELLAGERHAGGTGGGGAGGGWRMLSVLSVIPC